MPWLTAVLLSCDYGAQLFSMGVTAAAQPGQIGAVCIVLDGQKAQTQNSHYRFHWMGIHFCTSKSQNALIHVWSSRSWGLGLQAWASTPSLCITGRMETRASGTLGHKPDPQHCYPCLFILFQVNCIHVYIYLLYFYYLFIFSLIYLSQGLSI